LASSNIILSHAVHLSDEEIKLVKKYKIGVVHLPTSNKIHRSGEFKYNLFAGCCCWRELTEEDTLVQCKRKEGEGKIILGKLIETGAKKNGY